MTTIPTARPRFANAGRNTRTAAAKAARYARSGARHAWQNRPRDRSSIRTVHRTTGRVYADPTLGRVIAAWLILTGLAGLAGLALAAFTL